MILEIQNIGKNFSGLHALNNINFTLEKGLVLGLIGPNGSGKTTLFNVITGFYKPSSGKVIFDKKDITGQAPHKICKTGIARTFQLNKPFSNMTVQENVMVGLLHGEKASRSLRQARSESEAILELTGLREKNSLKAGMLGIVERKKLEVARALGANPKLLLLDEMMAGLNLREIEDAMKLVQKIRDSGITVVIVEHVMKAVLGISDHVIVLNAGNKIFEGSSQEVVKNKQVIEAYLGEYKHA